MKKISVDSLITFTRQLAYLVKMRFPLDECLRRLGSDLADGRMRRISAKMGNSVSSGKSLSESIAAFSSDFSPLYRKMVETGESTDSLDKILDQLAEYLEFSRKTVKEVNAALTYPAFLFTFLAAEMFIFFIAVSPGMISLFDGMNLTLPVPTRLLVAFGKTFSVWSFGAILAAGVLAVNCWHLIPGIAGDRFRLALPILGDLFRKLSFAQFARGAAILLASGVPLTEAIEYASRTVENQAAREHILNLKRKTERGSTLSRALSEIPYFSSTFAWMVSCGEKREELPGMMMEIADFYDSEVKLSTSAGIKVLEPLGMLAVGLLFGFMTIAMFLPLYQTFGLL